MHSIHTHESLCGECIVPISPNGLSTRFGEPKNLFIVDCRSKRAIGSSDGCFSIYWQSVIAFDAETIPNFQVSMTITIFWSPPVIQIRAHDLSYYIRDHEKGSQ